MGEHVSALVGQSAVGELLGLAPMFVAVFAVMYFLTIRPERKKQTEHQNLLASLKKGDEVVLTSGIIGKIEKVEDRTLTLDVGDKMRLRVLKVSVSGTAARFLAPPAAAAADKVPALADKADAEKKAV